MTDTGSVETVLWLGAILLTVVSYPVVGQNTSVSDMDNQTLLNKFGDTLSEYDSDGSGRISLDELSDAATQVAAGELGERELRALKAARDRGISLDDIDRSVKINVLSDKIRPSSEISFSVSAEEGQIEEADWDFTNDGTSDAEGKEVSHTYADPGSYTVESEVRTSNGENLKTTKRVEVKQETQLVYKGHPRSDYKYNGQSPSLFERWQSGNISTKYFQTATARGEGTASLYRETEDRPEPVGDSDAAPRDLDNDGVFEDVNGDGEVDMADVEIIANNFGSHNEKFFDFDGDGSVSPSDITSFRSEVVTEKIELSTESGNLGIGEPVSVSLPGAQNLDVESVGIDWTSDGDIDELLEPNTTGDELDVISLQHTYDSAGTYQARAVIELEDGSTVELTTEIAVEQSDTPMYKGRPRTDYSYTGNNRELFEKWQSGSISTISFQLRTERGEGTASLTLDPDTRNVSISIDTSDPVANEPTLFSVSSVQGDIARASWDFDGDGLFEARGSSVQRVYVYQEPGDYNVRANVEMRNGYTEELSLPVDIAANEKSLTYDIKSVDVPDAAVDRDVLSPRVEVQTNAEEVLFYVGDRETQLFDDGKHADSARGDMLYSNKVNVRNIVGVRDTGLRFKKDGRVANQSLGEIEFSRTPPKPGLDVNVTEDYIVINASRNGFSQPTNVEIRVYDQDASTSQPVAGADLRCTSSSECEARIENSFELGSNLLVNATQSFTGLTSQPAIDTVKIGGDPTIKSASVAAQYTSSEEVQFMRGQSWSDSGARITPAGFDSEDIASAHLTANGIEGKELGKIIDSREYVYFYENVSIPAEAVGTDDTASLGIKVELSDGTVLSEEIVRAPVVDDNTPPEVSIPKAVPLPNDPSADLEVAVRADDSLSESVQFEVKSKGEVLWSDQRQTIDGGDRPAVLDSRKLSVSGATPEIVVSATDTSGNTATDSKETIAKPDEVLEPVGTADNPRSKMNLVVYGQGMSTSETRETLRQSLEYYYNKNDLSVHGEFREYFNWYIVDSKDELCNEFDAQSNSITDDCPMLTRDPSFFFSQTDTMKRGRTGLVLFSDEDFRSYMFDDFTSISTSPTGWDKKKIFAHELGHLIWGFDDEYGQDNTIKGAFPTEFFKQADNTDTYDVENYSNTFESVQKCESKMRQVYDSLSPADCEQQKNGAIVLGDKGRSLMYLNRPVYYQTHVKRINNLIENSPVLEAS